MTARLLIVFARDRSEKVAGRRISNRGQAIVEFTLVFPFLLLLVGGAVDWGMAFFTAHVAQNAAREGARIAVTLPDLAAGDPRVETTVQEKLPDINLFSGFTVSNTVPAGPACGQEVTVSLDGSYNFTFLRLIGLSNLPMSRSVTMRYERQAVCE